MKIAVLLTCFNRQIKTIACLKSLYHSYHEANSTIEVEVFMTDDGCTDGTSSAVRQLTPFFPMTILNGNGNLFWNGGMNVAWKTALQKGGFNGYLWLNDDCTILPEFWVDIEKADDVSITQFGRKGIYVGSTCDKSKSKITYGGFFYTNKWLLLDEFVCPDGISYQQCCCAHGNITYISHEVVESRGILCEDYCHGGGDHDYTYLAYKAGYPILVLPHYAGICDNDHRDKIGDDAFENKNLYERLAYLRSPLGLNLHNIMLYQKRCFPYRYIPVLFTSYFKAIFPKMASKLYLFLRGVK